MDKERAKFILQSFRPDGEDSKEPAFTEALALATKDRELGEWLAAERAQDAAFSVMLSDVAIPDDLRDAIFEVLEGASDHPEDFDSDFVGALASVRPPDSLRDQILGAMEVEQIVVAMPKKKAKRVFLKTFMWTSSAAAVIAVMLVVMVFFAGAGGGALAGTTSREVERSAIEMLNSPFFSLDLSNHRQVALYEWLESKNLPTPSTLPAGLDGVKGVGCKFLEIGDAKNRASLICYKKEGKVVHLVMMEKKALSASEMNELQGAVGKCRACEVNQEWAITSWVDAEHSYHLIGQMTAAEMKTMF